MEMNDDDVGVVEMKNNRTEQLTLVLDMIGVKRTV